MKDQDTNGALDFFNGNGEMWFDSLPTNTAVGGDTTVEFFMRPDVDNSTTAQVPFAFTSNYMLAMKDGYLGFSTHADSSDIYGISSIGLAHQWTHVVAVFHNGAVTGSKLYINGVLQTLSQKEGTPVAVNAVASGSHVDGGFDELAIWNSALSATRVSAHYAASKAATATYAYNGDGLRASKTTDGTTTSFTWDVTQATPNLISDGSNYYIYGPDNLPVEQIDSSGNVLWFSHDSQGNTSFLTDSDEFVSAQYAYDAYGNVKAQLSRFDTPLRYRGQYQDHESGLIYERARYYDPSTAQFITVDPDVASTRSPYGYVDDSPTNGMDPSGLCVHFLWGCDIGQTSVGKDIVNTAGGILNGISFGLSNGWSASNGVDTCSTGFSVGFAGSMFIPGEEKADAARLASNPLAGVVYSRKVIEDMRTKSFHRFPLHVEAVAELQHVSKEIGKDGTEYMHVRIPGTYEGKDGTWSSPAKPDTLLSSFC